MTDTDHSTTSGSNEKDKSKLELNSNLRKNLPVNYVLVQVYP